MCSLIHSHRFRDGDLEVWRSHALADQLYARRYKARLEKMREEAINAIEDFLSKGEAYCSVSWGKDSVVVADICQELGVPLVHIKDIPNGSPECELVRDAFAPTRYEEIAVEWTFDGQCWHPPCKRAGFIEADAKYGGRRITGLRKQESTQRRLRGSHSTQSSCVPIAKWLIADVFAYLAWLNLPIHPAYAMSNSGQFDRNHLRVSAIGHKPGSGNGRREWELMYYGDILCSR